MFDFRGPDSVGQGTECAVGGRVGISTYDGHTGQGQSQLWADDVDNTVQRIVHIEAFNAKFRAVCGKCIHLLSGEFVGDWF